MALSKEEVLALIHKLMPDIREVYPDSEVYLFGSYAKEYATDMSDIDVGIVIPKFDDDVIKNWDKSVEIETRATRIDKRLSPCVLTPNNRSGLYDSVTKIGIKIA